MINKKWLIASLFIPLWGGIINLFICIVQFQKVCNKDKSAALLITKCLAWGLTLAFGFVLTMAAIAIISGVISAKTGVTIGTWFFPVAVVVAGYVANVVFFLYYRKRILPIFQFIKQLGAKNDD